MKIIVVGSRYYGSDYENHYKRLCETLDRLLMYFKDVEILILNTSVNGDKISNMMLHGSKKSKTTSGYLGFPRMFTAQVYAVAIGQDREIVYKEMLQTATKKGRFIAFGHTGIQDFIKMAKRFGIKMKVLKYSLKGK